MTKKEILDLIFAHEDRELAPRSKLAKKTKSELNKMLASAKRRYTKVNKEEVVEAKQEELTETKIEPVDETEVPAEYDGKQITAILDEGHTEDAYLCRGMDGTTIVEFHVPKSHFKKNE